MFQNWIYTSSAIIIIGIICILLFKIEDKYNVCSLLVIASLIAISSKDIIRWTRIDISLCLIVIYNIISCFYASCSYPAIHSTLFSIFSLTTYFLLRKLFTIKYATKIILRGSFLPIGTALFLAIYSFFIFRQSVLSVGFLDTYHFRFLFRPIGYITNVWAEILLILLGWSCIVRRYSKL